MGIIDVLDITDIDPPFSAEGTVIVGGPPAGRLITQLGDYLITQSGDYLIAQLVDVVISTTPVTYGGELDMIPMPDSMYPDVVRIRRKIDVFKGGRLVHEHGPPGPLLPACVDARRVDRSDPSGRVSVTTLYTISTPDDPALVAEDMVVWMDHRGTSRNLIIEGASVPQGQGDIEYIADAFQIV